MRSAGGVVGGARLDNDVVTCIDVGGHKPRSFTALPIKGAFSRAYTSTMAGVVCPVWRMMA